MTDEELIARLRMIHEWKVGNAAADRIEALVKERDEAINQLDSARHSVDVLEKRVAHFMSRAERLEAALRKIAEGNFIGRAEGYAFAALKGDDHA